ncbi:MAG: Rrf2 family transcriptional regulator, partial [Phycisphaerae bacterium]
MKSHQLGTIFTMQTKFAGETPVLALTKKAEYAIMALCHLARRERETVLSAREIATDHHIPSALLMNVLKSLNNAGLILSVRGVNGGYGLAVPAEDISLADVVEAVEGPVRFVRCADNEVETDPCELVCSCAIKQPLLRIHER